MSNHDTIIVLASLALCLVGWLVLAHREHRAQVERNQMEIERLRLARRARDLRDDRPRPRGY